MQTRGAKYRTTDHKPELVELAAVMVMEEVRMDPMMEVWECTIVVELLL